MATSSTTSYAQQDKMTQKFKFTKKAVNAPNYEAQLDAVFYDPILRQTVGVETLTGLVRNELIGFHRRGEHHLAEKLYRSVLLRVLDTLRRLNENGDLCEKNSVGNHRWIDNELRTLHIRSDLKNGYSSLFCCPDGKVFRSVFTDEHLSLDDLVLRMQETIIRRSTLNQRMLIDRASQRGEFSLEDMTWQRMRDLVVDCCRITVHA